MAAPPPSTPELMDELVGEILLRLPPDEPEHLFRAALACKPWLRILCDPAFRRRYRAFHGAPPLLGLLHRNTVRQGDPTPPLAPTTAAPLSPYPDHWRSQALDCRHGRVLLQVEVYDRHFVVWDPVTGDEHHLEDPGIPWLVYSASGAVLCAVPGCDHLDCHGGPFRAVFVFTDSDEELVKATVYSSETGAWSTPVILDSGGCEAYAQHTRDAVPNEMRRVTVIGDEAYFTLWWGSAIVKYDWGDNSISLIHPPIQYAYHVALMEMEDSSLGFACVQGSTLYLWSRKVNSEAAAEWIKCRAIELEKAIPVVSHERPFVVGCAEGMDTIFVSTSAALFTIRLHSGLVNKKLDHSAVYFSVLPYMSFYTPDRGRLLSLASTHSCAAHTDKLQNGQIRLPDSYAVGFL